MAEEDAMNIDEDYSHQSDNDNMDSELSANNIDDNEAMDIDAMLNISPADALKEQLEEGLQQTAPTEVQEEEKNDPEPEPEPEPVVEKEKEKEKAPAKEEKKKAEKEKTPKPFPKPGDTINPDEFTIYSISGYCHSFKGTPKDFKTQLQLKSLTPAVHKASGRKYLLVRLKVLFFFLLCLQ